MEYRLCLFQGVGVRRECGPKLLEALRQLERRRQGRQAEPSAGSVDSQSIKTATQATEVGFDGGKPVKGRKRHLLVDTLGLLMAVVVTAANTDDRVGFMLLLTSVFCGRGQAVTQAVGRWRLSSGVAGAVGERA